MFNSKIFVLAYQNNTLNLIKDQWLPNPKQYKLSLGLYILLSGNF